MTSNKDLIKYPSKEEIINALFDDEKLKDFEQFILILERKKVSENIGIIKGELIQNDDIVLRGKIAINPNSATDNFNWNDLEIGKSNFIGFSLDYKGETLYELFVEGLKNSIRDGKLPFIR